MTVRRGLESQQASCFVKGFAHGIIQGGPEYPIVAHPLALDELGMASTDQQQEEWKFHRR